MRLLVSMLLYNLVFCYSSEAKLGKNIPDIRMMVRVFANGPGDLG